MVGARRRKVRICVHYYKLSLSFDPFPPKEPLSWRRHYKGEGEKVTPEVKKILKTLCKMLRTLHSMVQHKTQLLK